MSVSVTNLADDEVSTYELPRIISVDDHVLEPPDLWIHRVPQRFQERAPRVVRQRGRLVGDASLEWVIDEEKGTWADVWYYEDCVKPLSRLFAAAGHNTETLDWEVVTFEDVRPGCWKQRERLLDMDSNHTQAALCFPNTLPRFCGQTFLEGNDKELSLSCIRAYNDWMIDEWCGGEAEGRLIPLIIVPLWDVALAAEEVHRCARRGAYAVSFTEGPEALGLPSVYGDYWHPFFAACAETDTTICMHIGSSSRLATTSTNAPPITTSVLNFQYGMHSFIDYIYSGTLEEFSGLKIMYSEANVGWMPYILERMDKMWHHRGHSTVWGGTTLPRPPSSYMGQVFACIIDDEAGLAMRRSVGMDQICFENDYPHADSTFPHSARAASQLASAAGLSDDEIYKLLRGNAIRGLGLDRFGISA